MKPPKSCFVRYLRVVIVLFNTGLLKSRFPTHSFVKLGFGQPVFRFFRVPVPFVFVFLFFVLNSMSSRRLNPLTPGGNKKVTHT